MSDTGLSAQAPLSTRIATAQEIAATKERLSVAVTDVFYGRHPEWVARFGEAGRQRCIEDTAFHLAFLGGAVEIGSTAAFCDYAKWTRRLLLRYRIPAECLVENLEIIGDALAGSLSSDSVGLVRPYLEAAVACLDEADPSVIDAPAAADDSLSVFVQAIVHGQRKEAVLIAREALRNASVPDVYSGLFQGALYRIGEGWHTGRLTVAQEHMATATVQYVIAQVYADLPLPATQCGNAVVTGVQGELHQVGANIVADILESDGWNVRFLGTNMPHAGILAVIEEHQASLLAISATMLFNLPRVRALIDEVRTSFGARAPRIVVGGGAFRSAAAFCQDLGVEGPGRDVADALRLCAA